MKEILQVYFLRASPTSSYRQGPQQYGSWVMHHNYVAFILRIKKIGVNTLKSINLIHHNYRNEKKTVSSSQQIQKSSIHS